MDKTKALKLLAQIEDNVGECCEVSMEIDGVCVLIDKLKKIIQDG
jgi:hypothetical protein